MRREAAKYLYDIQQAAAELVSFTAGKTREHYIADALLQAAVERKFEIIGEAVAQLAKFDERIAAQIPDYRRLIAFRNLLIHGYADVDDEIVWDLVQSRLPALLEIARRLPTLSQD